MVREASNAYNNKVFYLTQWNVVKKSSVLFSFQSCFFCCLLVVSYVINYVKIFLERKIRLSSPFLCAVNPNFLTRTCTEQQLPGCSSEFLLTGSYLVFMKRNLSFIPYSLCFFLCKDWMYQLLWPSFNSKLCSCICKTNDMLSPV